MLFEKLPLRTIIIRSCLILNSYYIFSFLQAVRKNLKLSCKCHGVSGACTIRTCWLAMQNFRRVGDYIKRKYNGATQVMMNQDGTGLIVANRNYKKPTRKDLVYLESSPDYCLNDLSIGRYQIIQTWPLPIVEQDIIVSKIFEVVRGCCNLQWQRFSTVWSQNRWCSPKMNRKWLFDFFFRKGKGLSSGWTLVPLLIRLYGSVDFNLCKAYGRPYKFNYL